MKEIGCIIRIKMRFNQLAKTERIIAKYILDNYLHLELITIKDLAEKTGVGNASILRFCKKLHFDGFQQFRIALARDQIKNNAIYAHTPINEYEKLILDVSSENIETIKNCILKLKEESLTLAIDYLLNAEKILLIGKGVSRLASQAFKYKLLKFGLSVDIIDDLIFVPTFRENVTNKTVIIVWDLAEEALEFLDFIKLLREKNIPVICCSHYITSDIVQVANVTLLFEATEDAFNDGELTALMAQINLIDIIYTSLASRKGDEYINKIERMRI